MVNQILKLSANQCKLMRTMWMNVTLRHFAKFRMHMSWRHDDDIILQNDVTLHWFALILRILLIFPLSQNHGHRPHSYPCRQQKPLKQDNNKQQDKLFYPIGCLPSIGVNFLVYLQKNSAFCQNSISAMFLACSGCNLLSSWHANFISFQMILFI